MKVCFIIISKNYYKAIYPLVVLKEMPFCNKIDRKKGAWHGGFLCVPYDI